jgi:hypothetical protein
LEDRFDPGRLPVPHHIGLGPDHNVGKIIFERTGNLAEFAIIAKF